MCMQLTRVLYSVVLTRQSNPPISQFNSPCNEFTSVWSMFVYNTRNLGLYQFPLSPSPEPRVSPLVCENKHVLSSAYLSYPGDNAPSVVT